MVTKIIFDTYKVLVFMLVTNEFKYNLHNHIYVYLLVCAIFVTLDNFCCFQTCSNFVAFIRAGYFLSSTIEIQWGTRSNDGPCVEYRPYFELS